MRNAQRMRLYGLSNERFLQMIIEQNGCCALCGNPVAKEDFKVDHDHNTTVVRGLLCNSCNVKLSGIEDAHFKMLAENYLARTTSLSGLQQAAINKLLAEVA
jgi:hypothetical protein